MLDGRRPVLDVIVSENQLPTIVEDLIPLRLIGETALRVLRQRYKHISTVELGQRERGAILADAAMVYERLIAIESRIGHLISQVPRARVPGPGRGHTKAPTGESPRSTELQEAERVVGGHRRAREAVLIFHNRSLAKDVIANSLAKADIPTRAALIRLIRKTNGTLLTIQERSVADNLRRTFQTHLNAVTDARRRWPSLDNEARTEVSAAIHDVVSGLQTMLMDLDDNSSSSPFRDTTASDPMNGLGMAVD